LFFELTVHYVQDLIAAISYPGLALLMALDATIVPVPSAAVMGFAGYLCYAGQLDLFAVTLAGSFGSTVGSLAMYLLAAYGGRPLLDRWGSLLGLNHKRIESTESWFNKHGNWTVFLAQFLPVVRDLIPFPAGLVRMNVKRFALLSFLGSIPFCFFLAVIGMASGPGWEQAIDAVDRYDVLVLIAAAIVLSFYLAVRRIRSKRTSEGEPG
jgi:membrane protein DedA with SNARE-associated domain